MKLRFLLMMLLFPLFCSGQGGGRQLIDSLEHSLVYNSPDSVRVYTLSYLSFLYSNIDPDKGISYGGQALDLAQKTHATRRIYQTYSALAANYCQKSDFPKGLECYYKALKIAEDRNNRSEMQLMFYNISSAYFNMENYPRAKEYSLKSLAICEPMHDSVSIASNYSNLGAIANVEGNQRQALNYQFRALDIFTRIHDVDATATCLDHICVCYYDLGKMDSALMYGERAKETNAASGNVEGEILNLLNIANAYMGLAAAHSGGTYVGKAIGALDSCMELNKDGDYKDLTLSSHEALARVYELKGDFKTAIGHLRTYMKLKDTLYSESSKLKLARLETQREADLKQKQIELNRLAESKKRNEQILLWTGIVLLLGIMFIIFRSYRQQKRANTVKGELLRQKDLLMREIHHRVKNNLQVISALLDLQLNNVSDETARDAMTESTGRVRSISLIHQQLYQDEHVSTIELSRFTADLLAQVGQVLRKRGQDIVLRSDIPALNLDIDTAVPLGLILNELMTNSYKYAFSQSAAGSIDISIEQSGNDYILRYKDSGPGLPEGINIAKLKSLGMRVVVNLSRQIGGTFMWQADTKTFVITFKDVQGRKETD